MSRPRSFDESDVLNRALDAFWRQGYEATSMQDLVDAMGISRASLYNAFGSKHALFIEVLKHYEQRRMHKTVERLRDASMPAKDAIRDVLEQAADDATTTDGRGCLMTKTATEMCARDPECADRVHSSFARIEAAFEAALERGRAAGKLAVDDVQAVARFLTNSLQGLRVMATAHTDPSALRDVVNVTMQIIE